MSQQKKEAQCLTLGGWQHDISRSARTIRVSFASIGTLFCHRRHRLYNQDHQRGDHLVIMQLKMLFLFLFSLSVASRHNDATAAAAADDDEDEERSGDRQEKKKSSSPLIRVEQQQQQRHQKRRRRRARLIDSPGAIYHPATDRPAAHFGAIANSGIQIMSHRPGAAGADQLPPSHRPPIRPSVRLVFFLLLLRI